MTINLHRPVPTVLRRLSVAGAAGALVLGLAACGDDTDSADATTAQTTTAAASGAESTGTQDAAAARGLSLTDGYVGAKTADKAMTAVFGELTNSTDKDIHLTKVTGDLDGVYQYHETVDGVMKQTDDGLTVPANGSVTLAPGGTHIMIMENHDEIAAGDALTLTLTAEDGSTYELADIPVRVQQSGHEDYGTDGMDGMDMGGSDSTGGSDSAHSTTGMDGMDMGGSAGH